MQTTTIQVETPTKKILENMKRDLNYKTYDELIKTLLRKKTKSLYASMKNKDITTKEMLKRLRDKNDRY